MKEIITIRENLRVPQADFNFGVHGDVDAEQALYSGPTPSVELHILSQNDTGIYMQPEHVRKITERVIISKGGEIFNGKNG